MKLTNKPKPKMIIVTVACLLVVLLGAGASFAAYTSQSAQRGVVRNRDNEAVRFTSNYLQPCAEATTEASYAGRTVLFGEEDKKNDMLSVDIYVYNYVSGTDMVSQRDITYKMEITIKAVAGSNVDISKCSVTAEKEKLNGTDGKYTKSGMRLNGRVARSHKYTVTFPGSALDQLQITATATPTDLSVTNGQKLAAILSPCTAAETKTFSANGEFLDASGNTTPSEYAAFNYLISISSGTATVTLTWNNSLLEIDQYFLKKINGTIAKEDGNTSVTFTMDQPNGTGEYLIPFYMKNKTEISKKTWDEMNQLITFEAKQNEAGA